VGGHETTGCADDEVQRHAARGTRHLRLAVRDDLEPPAAAPIPGERACRLQQVDELGGRPTRRGETFECQNTQTLNRLPVLVEISRVNAAQVVRANDGRGETED